MTLRTEGDTQKQMEKFQLRYYFALMKLRSLKSMPEPTCKKSFSSCLAGFQMSVDVFCLSRTSEIVLRYSTHSSTDGPTSPNMAGRGRDDPGSAGTTAPSSCSASNKIPGSKVEKDHLLEHTAQLTNGAVHDITLIPMI